MSVASEMTSACSQSPTKATPTSKVRRLLTRCVIIGVIGLINLVVLEIGLRATGRYRMDNSEGYFQRGGISYLLKKNVTKEVRWPTMSFTVHTSDLGFRAKRPGPQIVGERPYYVALGASDVFGNGLNYEDTFVGILDGKLGAQGIDVVNMGVAGHHLQEQVALFKSFVSARTNAPRTVVLFFNPLLIGGFDDNHTDVLIKRGDLFQKDSWRTALLRKMLQNTSAAYCFFRDSIRSIQRRFSTQKEFALSFYIEKFSTKHPIRTPARAQEFLRNLDDFEQYLRGLNVELVYVYCPPAGAFLVDDLKAKGRIDPQSVDTRFFVDLVRDHAQEKGVRFISLEPPAQERYGKGEKLTFDSDGHFNGPTSRVVGEYLYKMLNPGPGMPHPSAE